MSQTGTIYGYHDGNTYSLANIYDENLSEYNDPTTMFLMHFDINEGIIDEKNLWNTLSKGSSASYINFVYNGSNHFYYSDQYSTTLKQFADLKIDSLQYISDENAKFDYALQFSKSNKNGLIFIANGRYPFYFINMNGSATFEMWFSIPPTLSSDTGTLFTATIGNVVTGKTLLTHTVSYSYSKNNDTVVPKILNVELPSNTFDAPFHFAEVFSNYGKTINTFVNGTLIKTSTSTHSTASASYIQLLNIKIGSGSYCNGALSEFRLSKGSLYTDNFSVQTVPFTATMPVPANMLIRHNDANHYIPLTTNAANTSAPYIAVRHGNTNYYAIK